MSFRRDGYHHGNLREALIQAALQLITQRGLGGFAFAELARAAGVSPAAPYRHFRDRNALLAELARRGFEQLEAALEQAWNQGRPDPAVAIERCGRAHLAFARAEPASYAAMFDGSPAEADPALKAAADAAFAVIRRAADAACAAATTAPRPPALMVALHVWSLCHGVAALFVGPPSPARRTLPMSAEDLLEAGLLVYLRSLGLGQITSP